MSEDLSINKVVEAYNKVPKIISNIKSLREKLNTKFSELPSSKSFIEELNRMAFHFKRIKDPLNQFLNKVTSAEFGYARLESEINDAWEVFELTLSEPGKLTLVIPGNNLIDDIRVLPKGVELHGENLPIAKFFVTPEGELIKGPYLIAVLEQKDFGLTKQTVLDDYNNKVEPYVKMFFKTRIPEALQNYINKLCEEKGISKELWYEYPVNHPDERISVIKILKSEAHGLDEQVSEEDHKQLFERKEIDMPDAVAVKIQDAFYDNIGILRKEYSEKNFNKLKIEIESYRYLISQFISDRPKRKTQDARAMDLKPSVVKGTLQSRLKELNTKNQKLLSEYPKIKELM